MERDIEGVYSRMYRAMADHKCGLISFEEMLARWKEEANLIKMVLKIDDREYKKYNERVKLS